jgi:hypothetical protein
VSACYCGRLYPCEDCGGDVCNCQCRTDGAPQTQTEATTGYMNPAIAQVEAWANKQELKR